MTTDPQGTNVGVVVGIYANSSRVTVTADVGPSKGIHVRLSDDLALVGSPEDMLAFARALASDVERAVPVELLLAEWVRDEGEAVQP